MKLHYHLSIGYYSSSLPQPGHMDVEGEQVYKRPWPSFHVGSVILIVYLSLVLLMGSATPQTTVPRLKVATTIFPLYDLVRNVAGPAVEVVLLLPPGASPHTFEAKPGTIRTLTGSTILFAIGHGLDDWAIGLAQGAGVPRLLVVDAHITLRTGGHAAHEHGTSTSRQHTAATIDPHYWLAIPNAVHMVETITRALVDLDPATAPDYRQRATAYQEQLRLVDTEFRALFAALPRRYIATFHQAFDYFADAYGLQVVAAFEPSPGQEPPPRHVEAFLRQVRTHKLRVLFVEPQLPQGALASLARDLKVRLEELDPNGGSPGRDSYLALMRFNASQIAAALRE
jgi:ABC-type Zn uptake system ZnuABC Zn-binding protein ZnuA